jgi:hypothetical protein
MAPFNGGSAITGYTAQCTSSNGGVPGSAAGASSPITVGSLTNGRSYTCTVYATNAAGNSGVSSPSASATPGNVPTSPSGVIAHPVATTTAKGSLLVAFVASAGNGSAVTGYTASCTSTNGGAPGSQQGKQSPISVPNLATGSRYTCTVTAANTNGTSPPSAPSPVITVGAPAVPRLVGVLSLPTGLAVKLMPNANNGSAITGFRARCSAPGGQSVSPFQTASPIVALNLTVGADYTCIVTAANLRGPSLQVTTPLVKPGASYHAASCTGATGSVTLTHGLFLKTKKNQTIDLKATTGKCTGPYVKAGRMNYEFRTSTPVSCQSVSNVQNGGFGTLTWTVPSGMGTSQGTMRFIFVSTTGHTTKVHFFGTITSKANVFTGRHISGNLTLNRGLRAKANGGDCVATKPLINFAVTAIGFSIT